MNFQVKDSQNSFALPYKISKLCLNEEDMNKLNW